MGRTMIQGTIPDGHPLLSQARFKKVKSPAELVAGVIKLVGTYRFPDFGIECYSNATNVMGQDLLNPPTVEGWHTGKEWIDGGTLNERVNFAVDEVADLTKPGVKTIIDSISGAIDPLPAEKLVDRCLELAGAEVGAETRRVQKGARKLRAEVGSELPSTSGVFRPETWVTLKPGT